MIRPREQKARVVSSSAHRIVTGAVRAADHYRECGHGRIRNRVDELRAISDDALLFVSTTHHETGNVLKENQRDALLIAELNELRALAGRLGHQHAVVCEYPDREAVDVSKAGDECCTVLRFELIKLRAVN